MYNGTKESELHGKCGLGCYNKQTISTFTIRAAITEEKYTQFYDLINKFNSIHHWYIFGRGVEERFK